MSLKLPALLQIETLWDFNQSSWKKIKDKIATVQNYHDIEA
jgi:hypothetical protein